MSAGPARILVRCPNHLGDVVMTTPGLAALRAAYPKSEIVAALPAPLVPLLAGTDLVDAVWPVVAHPRGFGALRAEVARIKDHEFDLGLAIPESISSALAMRMGRVRRIVGFARDPVRARLLDERVVALPEWGRRRLVSRERFVLRLMQAVGVEAPPGPPRLRLATTVDEESRFEAALRAQAASQPEAPSTPASPARSPLDGKPFVVLAPGAGYGDAKCWPRESFAALADRLAERGARVALVGGPGEGERIRAIARRLRRPALVFDGTLDLGALKVLLGRAQLLVANDAGTRHVAAAFGIPSVVFFGPTSVAKTADNLERVQVLERDHACRPCYLRSCPIDHRCLRRITVDEAVSGTERALGEWAAIEGAERGPGAGEA